MYCSIKIECIVKDYHNRRGLSFLACNSVPLRALREGGREGRVLQCGSGWDTFSLPFGVLVVSFRTIGLIIKTHRSDVSSIGLVGQMTHWASILSLQVPKSKLFYCILRQ